MVIQKFVTSIKWRIEEKNDCIWH